MTVSVRPAEPRDFEAVTSLLEELGRPKVLGGGEEVEHRRRFEAWLSDPDLDAFVGEIDGEVAGFIDLAFVQRLNFGAPQAWVPDLIVREHARSRGVGAALLARVERAARERGAFALTLESANWRTRAHAFYLRQGMADEAKEFVRVLKEVGWPPPPPPPESEPRGPTRPS
jgi:GNAT superfamily N-acetyltransferase